MLLIKRNDWIRMSLIWKLWKSIINDIIIIILSTRTSSYSNIINTDTDRQRSLMLSCTQFSIFVLRILWWSHTLLYCSLTWTLAHHLISQAALLLSTSTNLHRYGCQYRQQGSNFEIYYLWAGVGVVGVGAILYLSSPLVVGCGRWILSNLQ